MPEISREIVLRLYNEALNRRRPELVDDLIAEHAVWSLPPLGVIRGREAIGGLIRGILNAFPDVHYFLDRVIVQDGEVAVCWHTTATHLGDFLGVPGTGKPAPCSGITCYRVEYGFITEATGSFDALGLLQSVGAAPPLGQSPYYAAMKSAFTMYGQFFRSVSAAIGTEKAVDLHSQLGRDMGSHVAALIRAHSSGHSPDTHSITAALKEHYDGLGVSYNSRHQPGKVVMTASRCPVYDGLSAAGLDHAVIQSICTCVSGNEHAALREQCPAVSACLSFRPSADSTCVEEFALVS